MQMPGLITTNKEASAKELIDSMSDDEKTALKEGIGMIGPIKLMHLL